jgi:hypothetical protein
MSASAGTSPGLTLPVGHRLGPLHVPGRTDPWFAVRRGADVELLDRAEAAAWELLRPRRPLPGDAVAARERLAAGGLPADVLDRLRARGLAVDVDPVGDDLAQRSARLRARPLGAAVGGDPATDTVLIGAPGRPLWQATGAQVEVWSAAVGAGDLGRAAALLLLLRDPGLDRLPDAAARDRPLLEIWQVLPEVLAAGCGYLDTAG